MQNRFDNLIIIDFLFISSIIVIYFYLLLIFFDIKTFTIWSQITDIYNSLDPDSYLSGIQTLFSEHHPHALRALLIFPIYLLSSLLEIDVVMVYNIVLVFLLFGMYRLISFITYHTINKAYPLGILIFFISISFFMHGRILFAMFGNTLILFALFKYEYTTKLAHFNFFILICFGILFCSVSSGTMMVAIGSILLFYFLHSIRLLPFLKKKYLFIYIVAVLGLIVMLPIIIQLVSKNLNFFHGSFLLMLSHGMGKYLLKYWFLVSPIVLLAPYILYRLYLLVISYPIYILPLSMMVTSLLIGVFGISSLVSGFPAYILFLYLIANHALLKKIKYV